MLLTQLGEKAEQEFDVKSLDEGPWSAFRLRFVDQAPMGEAVMKTTGRQGRVALMVLSNTTPSTSGILMSVGTPSKRPSAVVCNASVAKKTASARKPSTQAYQPRS